MMLFLLIGVLALAAAVGTYFIGVSVTKTKPHTDYEKLKSELLRLQAKNIELTTHTIELNATVLAISEDFEEMAQVAEQALMRMNELEIENAALRINSSSAGGVS